MFHVLTCEFGLRAALRSEAHPLKRPESLAGKPVRIVFDDSAKMMAALRDLCAVGARPIELLDIDKHRWGFVSYDPPEMIHRLEKLGLPYHGPIVQWLTTNSALWLIGRLTTEQEAANAA